MTCSFCVCTVISCICFKPFGMCSLSMRFRSDTFGMGSKPIGYNILVSLSMSALLFSLCLIAFCMSVSGCSLGIRPFCMRSRSTSQCVFTFAMSCLSLSSICSSRTHALCMGAISTYICIDTLGMSTFDRCCYRNRCNCIISVSCYLNSSYSSVVSFGMSTFTCGLSRLSFRMCSCPHGIYARIALSMSTSPTGIRFLSLCVSGSCSRNRFISFCMRNISARSG